MNGNSTVQNSTVRKSFTLWLSPEMKLAAQKAAAEREMSLTVWIRQAIKAYLRTARRNAPKLDEAVQKLWPSGYPRDAKCFHCKQCGHDPLTEHGYSALGEVDVAWGLAHMTCKA